MAKSKKSKILAMALCASVMTGIYASPVMAAELYEYNGPEQWVTTNGGLGTKITELEGLKEITLGNSVKITTDGKGIIRVGDVNGVNTRVHNDGFYINKTGHDQKTSLTAGTLTLAGKELTSVQLDNINDVITNDGAVKSKGDVTSEAGGGKTYSLNTVGANTSGITRDIEGKVTTIEGAFSVDKKGHIYNANRSFQVTKDGAARFGNKYDDHIRMDDGVLSVKTDQNTIVARVSKDGLMLSDSVNGQQTLTAAKIADIQHIKHVGNATVFEQNTAISADGIVVRDPGSGVSTKTKYDGFYVKDKDRNIVSSLEDDGLMLTDQESGETHTLNATDIADIKGIDRVDTNNDGTLDTTVIEKTLAVSETGIAMSKGDMQLAVNEAGFAAVKGENAIYLNENGVNLSAGNDNFVSVTQDGIGLQGGTSQVIMNSNNGAVFRNGDKAVNGETVINGGSITTGTVNGVAIGMKDNGDITLGNNVVIDGDFNSDNIAGITRVERNDSEPGSEVTYIEKNTAVSADGILVEDPVSGVSTKTKYDGFYVKDKDSNIVSSLKDDGLMLTDPGSGVSTKTKYDGFYVKDEYGNNVSSLKNDGLMLTDQESGKTHTLNATDIADIKGIDRVDTNNDGTLDTTVIEKTLAVSETGIAMSKGDMQLAVNEAGFAAVKGENAIYLNENGVNLSAGNDNFVSVTQDGIGLQGGTSQVIMNSNNGAVFRNGDKAVNGETVINGGTITTGSTTITSDSITTKTLNVDKIVLGDKIVDKDTGDVIGGELEIGADGSIKIDNAGTDAVEFNATKTALSANYGETSLNMDSDGFNLNYGSGTSLNMNSNGFNLNNGTGADAASLVLSGSGFAFKGSVNLGKGSDVKYTDGNYDTLAKLDATVKDIYDRTDGIYKDIEGNTVISNEKGKWNDNTQKTEHKGEGSKVVVGANGTTFENGADNGTTNIDGSKITSDANGTISGGSGSSTNTIEHPVGSSTTNGEETVYDGENGNTNTVNSSGMTVTNSTSTTVIDAEKVDTTTGNFSNKVTVGIQGNQTVITGGDISVDNSVTVAGGSENKTTINNEGITVGDKGTSIKNDSISVGDGGYIGDGDVRSGEGVSLNDTAERVGHLENRVGKLEDRVDKVGAMAAAIANLRTMGYDPAAPTEVAVGIGQYRDETGAALGLFHYPNRDFMLSLSVSTSGDEVMGGIGATWKFGRKSPEKVAEIKKAQAEADARRAEEAKLAKAEEMKQAAKEAKIKAQQERHAKLAAQAEAAK